MATAESVTKSSELPDDSQFIAGKKSLTNRHGNVVRTTMKEKRLDEKKSEKCPDRKRMEATAFYERQFGKRRCGAATLVMVYRSFGLATDQETLWNELQSYSAEKTRTRSFHLAQNALEHGFSAVVVRVCEPASFLLADFSQARMIPVCRMRRDSGKGHFSLFLGTDGQTVSLHDPMFGPNRSLDFAEFLELWTPRSTGDEITRNVAVLITVSRNEPMVCPTCSETFSLAPLRFFDGEAFETMFCPYCDGRCTLDRTRSTG